MDHVFKTAQEETLYIQCQQILSNHIGQQHLSFQETLSAVLGVLGYQLASMPVSGDDIQTLITNTIDALQDEYKVQNELPLPGFADYTLDYKRETTQPLKDLGNALATHMMQVGGAHAMSVAGLWRVCVAICGDVLAMPRLVQVPLEGVEDYDAYIAGFHRSLSLTIDHLRQEP